MVGSSSTELSIMQKCPERWLVYKLLSSHFIQCFPGLALCMTMNALSSALILWDSLFPGEWL